MNGFLDAKQEIGYSLLNDRAWIGSAYLSHCELLNVCTFVSLLVSLCVYIDKLKKISLYCVGIYLKASSYTIAEY